MKSKVFIHHRKLLVVCLLLALQTQITTAQQLPTGAMKLAPDTYDDVFQGHWAGDAIARMSAIGVLTGYPDSTFRGDESATRYQLAVVLARLFDIYTGAYPLPTLLPMPQTNSSGAADAGEQRLVNPHLLAELSDERIDRLEQALENTPSFEYVQHLEQRVATLERALTEATGEAPSATTPEAGTFPLRAADTVPPEPTLAEMLATAEGTLPAGSQAGSQLDSQPSGERVGAPPSEADDYWFGVSASYPLGAAVHFGVHDVIGIVDLRGSTSLLLDGPLELALDVLIELPIPTEELPTEVYAGLGPNLSVATTGGTLSLQAVLGIEYRLGPGGRDPGGFFGEVGTSVGIIPELDTKFVARAGFNYHLR